MNQWPKTKKENAIKIILERLSNGESINSILETSNEDRGLPDAAEFDCWLREDKALQIKYLELTRYNSTN